MYIVRWCDYEGSQHEREFARETDARLEAEALQEYYDYVEIVRV